MSAEEREKADKKVREVFRMWIKNHFYDFENDPELLATLNKFLTHCAGEKWSAIQGMLHQRVRSHWSFGSYCRYNAKDLPRALNPSAGS